ncbi:MAG: saccharopine dehydrogenase family protein [Granulosicoccaceae bacterium]
MTHVHWLGTGLSTAPGIRRLAQSELPLSLWNRTPEKAEAIIAGLETNTRVRSFDLDALASELKPGHIAVSMLPGDWHPVIAKLCIDKGAHFVSSSYISPEMRELAPAAEAKGLSLVNEIGLDPGIDHLMAHALVADYKASPAFDTTNQVYFRSYCGGVPKTPNDFRYKFSWSPLGVLKALKSPSRSIRNGAILDTQRPWDAISDYTARLPDGSSEVFQAYPNRDATPFMEDYQFGADWNVQEFVRGTLRLQGWSDAWQPLFEEIETLQGDAGEARLVEMSEQLWETESYDEGEPDRVVLVVELEARRQDGAVWHQCYTLDAAGDAQDTAMARLVSTPLSLAIEATAQGQMPAGLCPASKDLATVHRWMDYLKAKGEPIARVDYLA